MPRPRFAAALALLACSVAALAADRTTPERIARVERTLRPPVAFEGDEGWRLEDRMRHYGTPGMTVAVIEDFEIAWVRHYGLRDREAGLPVTAATLFQAGSVSKPVAAYGALKLVAEGKLDLEADVNRALRSWKLPDNAFTRETRVNLTHLLSHTGGLTVHGFPGYAPGEPVPTVPQILDGSGPANTAPVRVDKAPGEGYRYSGGGYTVAQLMMTDATGESFPELMSRRVLVPLGMKRSTFANPLPPKRLAEAAAGYRPDKSAVPGKRHTYPEMAAAGLWTTADDLARFAIGVQQALRGRARHLSKAMAEKLVEPVTPGYGRGFGLWDRAGEPYFGHNGWDEGFCAQLNAHRSKGYGAVVMINSNHPDLMREVVHAIALEYGWDGYELLPNIETPQAALERYPGRYRYNAEQVVRIDRSGQLLFMHYAGGERQQLKYIGDDRFMRRERGTPISFTEDDSGATLHFVLGDGSRQSHPRLRDDERMPREVLIEGDYAKALPVYQALKEGSPDDPAISERWINGQGLAMAAGELYDPALALLKINTVLYPKSANTWDSVGHVYRQMGDRDNAIAWYEKALKVDPKFGSAVRALEELKTAPD